MQAPHASSAASLRHVTLAALCDGGLFSDGDWITTADQDPAGEVRLVQLADIGIGEFRDRSSRYLRRTRAVELGCTFVSPMDVLVARMPDPVGRACLVPDGLGDAVVAVDITILRPPLGRVDREWLMTVLNTVQVQAQVFQYVRGTTRQRISRTNLGKIELPLPSVDDQGLAAAAFRVAEEASRAVGESLAMSAQRVQTFRDWIPTAAVSDRLRTPSASPGEVAPPEEGTISWPVVTLGDLLLDARYGTAKRLAYEQQGTPVLRIPNVVAGTLDLRDVKYADLSAREQENLALRPEDLLMVRSNGSVRLLGRTARVTRSAVGKAFAGYLIRLRPVMELVDPDYLQLALASASVRRDIERPARSSAGVHNINLTEIKRLCIPLAPRQLQTDIARRAYALLERSELLLTVVARASGMRLNALETLRSAVFEMVLRPSQEALAGLTRALPQVTVAAAIGTARRPPRRASDASPSVPPSVASLGTGSALLGALVSAGRPLTSEELFMRSGFPSPDVVTGVEAFYAALREAESTGAVEERRSGSGEPEVLIALRSSPADET